MSRSAYACTCAAYNLRVTTNEPKQAEKSVTEFLPPYAVILHNDDVNEMAFVAQALLNSVPELGQEDAVRIMLVAHNDGTGRGHRMSARTGRAVPRPHQVVLVGVHHREGLNGVPGSGI